MFSVIPIDCTSRFEDAVCNYSKETFSVKRSINNIWCGRGKQKMRYMWIGKFVCVLSKRITGNRKGRMFLHRDVEI